VLQNPSVLTCSTWQHHDEFSVYAPIDKRIGNLIVNHIAPSGHARAVGGGGGEKEDVEEGVGVRGAGGGLALWGGERGATGSLNPATTNANAAKTAKTETKNAKAAATAATAKVRLVLMLKESAELPRIIR
jgi:hypothetical protein